MADNPIHIPAVFAVNGLKNVIQKVRQVGQAIQDFTWVDGTPAVTMIDKDDGGLAPKGQDFNGVLNAISEHTVFNQNGGRYKWSQDVIDNYGGYSKDFIIQSDNGQTEWISLVDNNTRNPNDGLGSDWKIYAGQGSVPIASSTTAGIVRVLNVLTSTDITASLSAAQGKQLLDWLDVVMYSPIPYPKASAPAGFIPMDGRALTAAQYPKLFALYGSNLPNMADEFIRGKSASRAILSRQSDELRSHSHQIPDTDLAAGVGNLIENDGGSKSSRNIQTYSTGGTETRPRNIAFLYIVKAG